MRPIERTLLITRRQRRPRQRPPIAGARLRGGALGCGALLAILFAVAVLAAAVVISSATAGLPVLERLPALLAPETGLLQQPTHLYDRSGRHLLYRLENPGAPRRSLALDPDLPDHFSPLLVQMIVAVDDPSFWQHAGVTWAGAFDAQPNTLAERLVNSLLLDQEAPGWRRTLRMRLLAAQVTARYGRAQVLEWYLNNAYFGHLAYGAESAAQLYLGKSARDVNLAEVALLIAVEEAPALNPLDAPSAALERMAVVLDRLLEDGHINDQDYLRARAEVLGLQEPLRPAPQPASAFAALVLEQLEQRFGRERVERGGLRVITTLDYGLQLETRCAAQQQVVSANQASIPVVRLDGADCTAARRLTGGARVDAPLQASAAVLDVQSGQVLAYLGDTGLTGPDSRSAAHPPGTLLSPFAALAGFARGMGPASLVWDIPAPGSAVMEGYLGPLRLRTALEKDTLAPFEAMMRQVGPGEVLRLAETLGMRSLARETPSEALLSAGGSVSLLEVAQAYSVFARIGELAGEVNTAGGAPQPVLVLSVQSNDGEIWLEERPTQVVPVLSAPLAWLAHDSLREGSASQPSAARTARAGAGVWGLRYTPQRLVVTWVGTSTEGARLDPRLASTLASALLEQASTGLPVLDWSEPPGLSHVEVCDPSGLLPTAACPNVVREVFLTGSEPQQFDTLYRSVQVNRETGRLATVFTPPAQISEQTFLAPPPEAEAWARAAGIPQPPKDYDSIQPPQWSPDVRLDAPGLFTFVRGQVQIAGTAAGADFVSYRLQVGQGLNPQRWILVSESSIPVNQGALGAWDTTGLDGLYALQLQVLRSGSRLETSTIQVTVDNVAPQARILYPGEGAQLIARAGERLTLQTAASDNIAVTRVEWLLDGLMLDQPGGALSYAWQPTPGRHRLQVRVSDAAGNVTETETVTFEGK